MGMGHIKLVTERPERPDGKKYNFNCCLKPRVVEDIETEEKYCKNCGYKWTEELS